MREEHSTERLEHLSGQKIQQQEPSRYTPRPKSHIIMAWVLVAVVIFAFLGTCYWLMFGKF